MASIPNISTSGPILNIQMCEGNNYYATGTRVVSRAGVNGNKLEYVKTLGWLRVGNATLEYHHEGCQRKDKVNRYQLETLFAYLVHHGGVEDVTCTVGINDSIYTVTDTRKNIGHLSIYYLDHEKIRFFSIDISNTALCKKAVYLKYYLMFICDLFENNFEEYPVKIINAILTIDSESTVQPVSIIKYSEKNEKNFEEKFEIISETISEDYWPGYNTFDYNPIMWSDTGSHSNLKYNVVN